MIKRDGDDLDEREVGEGQRKGYSRSEEDGKVGEVETKEFDRGGDDPEFLFLPGLYLTHPLCQEPQCPPHVLLGSVLLVHRDQMKDKEEKERGVDGDQRERREEREKGRTCLRKRQRRKERATEGEGEKRRRESQREERWEEE